jgi:predicted cupin superfamily sugar epimerase
MSEIPEIIQSLQLEPHCEGGYYRRTYLSDIECTSNSGKARATMSSIYYLVTQKKGMSYLAANESDLMLFHHAGAPLKVIFIDEQGDVEEKILGTDFAAGQQPQMLCPGGVWKAYELMSGEYTLVSEALSPSFDYDDLYLPDHDALRVRSPQHYEELKKFITPVSS